MRLFWFLAWLFLSLSKVFCFVEGANWEGKLRIQNKVGQVLHVGWKLIKRLVVATGCCVQVQLVCGVDDLFLHGEHIWSQFHLTAKGAQEISEGKLRLSNWECGLCAFFDVLITVMEEYFYCFCCEQLFDLRGVWLSKQKYMFLLKLANWLLRHFLGWKSRIINKLELCVDGFELGVSLEWNIFASVQTNLQGVQLLAQVRRKQSSWYHDFYF